MVQKSFRIWQIQNKKVKKFKIWGLILLTKHVLHSAGSFLQQQYPTFHWIIAIVFTFGFALALVLIWPLAPFIIERKCNELPAAAAAEENIFSQWSHRNPWDIWPYGERNTVVYAPQQFPFFFPWGTVNHMCVDGGQSERGNGYSSLESRRDRECL